MSRTVMIDPVSRIEGHAKITIQLDDLGDVVDAHFHVVEFRGFEKFCEGRPLTEMPSLTGRICGICPVSHLMASAKAGDAILSVRIPPAADRLRRIMNLGQMLQSHALSFYYLSGPDLLLGWDADPAIRNVFGLAKANPELARKGIRLRQFGQEVIEQLGGKRIHPAWAVPGGVRSGLTLEAKEKLLAWIPEARATVTETLSLFKGLLDSLQDEVDFFGHFPSLFLSLVGPEGAWEHYDGHLRICDAMGHILADGIDPADYLDHLGEAVESDSYLKFPYYKPLGYPEGIYRVGPLARLNTCTHIGTPLADVELLEYRQRFGSIVNASFLFHYARLIEMLAAVEYIERLLNDPESSGTRLRAEAEVNQLHGVGVSEAPRGTLFHDYTVDGDGLIQKVNLLIATGQNNLAMNKTVAQIARHCIHGTKIPEGVLNRIEAGVRTFDPCLSCSTHAYGSMPMVVQLLAADGGVVDEVRRD